MIKEMLQEVSLCWWFIGQGFKRCHTSFTRWQWLMKDWESTDSIDLHRWMLWTWMEPPIVNYCLSDRLSYLLCKGAID